MRRRMLYLCGALLVLAGCGTSVPPIAEPWEGSDGTKKLELNIKKAVFCEIRDAVRDIRIQETVNGKAVDYLPGNWGTQVTLSLQIDESGALNPGIAVNQPIQTATSYFPGGLSVMTPESFSLGFGGNLSSQATRVDKFNFYYLVSDLRKPVDPEHDICNNLTGVDKEGSSFFLLSELGIKQWLADALEIDRRLPSSSSMPAPAMTQSSGAAPLPGATSSGAGSAGGSPSSPKPDTVSYEIRFIVVTAGNVTPTWRLVRISANTGTTPLLNINRTRTHDLIVTLGPSTGPEAQTAVNLHEASLIGSATASSLRPLLQQ